MTIYPEHHTYNIQLTENVFQSNLLISKFSIAAPTNLILALHMQSVNGLEEPF